MDTETLNYLVGKAHKIYLYEKHPQTDEQFLIHKMGLVSSYRKAERNFQLTSKSKYSDEMKRIKGYLSRNVSKTEYEFSKKIIEENKALYSGVINEKYWEYRQLNAINFYILSGDAKSVEEAVLCYEKELSEIEEVKRLAGVEGRDISNPEVRKACMDYLEKINS